MKIKFNLKYIINLLILIPFLYPKGFEIYNEGYKNFFSGWLYFSIVLIIIRLLFKIYNKKLNFDFSIIYILLYYFIMIIITYFMRHSFADGLQKMFVSPLLIIFIHTEFLSDYESLIIAINKLLSLSIILGLTVFSSLFWQDYFSPEINHIFFWGHVQVGAQIGLLYILFIYLEYNLMNRKNKYRLFFRYLLVFIMCIISKTSMSHLLIGVLLLFYLSRKHLSLRWRGRSYVLFYLVLNIMLFAIITKNGLSINIGDLSINGRGFIWSKAINSFLRNPIFGYGVQGVLIKVFWSDWVGDGSGLNYMHNQLLQVLNDGGLILLIFFLILLFTTAKNIDKINNIKLRRYSYIIFQILLLTMCFESTLEYFYLVIVITALFSLKSLDSFKHMHMEKTL